MAGRLDKSTVIPLGLVFGLISIVAGAAWLLGTDKAEIVHRIDLSDKRVNSLEQQLGTLSANQKSNTERLIRIDENVRFLKETINK